MLPSWTSVQMKGLGEQHHKNEVLQRIPLFSFAILADGRVHIDNGPPFPFTSLTMSSFPSTYSYNV